MTYNLDFDPPRDVSETVAPGIRRLTAANPSPHTFRGTNTYILGRDRLTVMDPGPDDPAHTAAILAVAGGMPIERIILTHGHHDHTAGVPRLAEATRAPVHLAPSKAKRDGVEGGAESRSIDLDGSLPIRDGEVIAGDGFALTAIATPGHASNHICFALAGTPILFSGDHVMGWSTTVVSPPDGSMADYMRSLELLLARPERRYLPGHGAPIENGPEYVRGLRGHRKMREAAIVERLRAGDRTIPEIVAVLYRGLDPRLTRSAGNSVLAHLEDLVARGLVRTDGSPKVDGTFVPA